MSDPTATPDAPYRITIDLFPAERRMFDALMSDTNRKGAEIIREAIRLLFHTRSRRRQGWKLMLSKGLKREVITPFDDIISEADESFIAGESRARSLSKISKRTPAKKGK